MKTYGVLVATLVMIVASAGHSALAQSTEFTYQGRLLSAGVPANGPHDFEFSLWDAASGGTQLGPTPTMTGVNVNNGVFSVRIDFGDEFPGASRFLEIKVRQSGDGFFTLLTPRQAITSAPYAIKSLNADYAAESTNATNAAQLGGAVASSYVLASDPRLADARTPLPDSRSYIQNTTILQPASFNISGTGLIGGNLAVGGATFMTGTLFVRNGNASVPGITFQDDQNTGIFRSANDTLNFSTSGVSRLLISSIGNIGIGTPSPAAPLDVAGTVRATALTYNTVQTRYITLAGAACVRHVTGSFLATQAFFCDMSDATSTPLVYWTVTPPHGVTLVGLQMRVYTPTGATMTCSLRVGQNNAGVPIATVSDTTSGWHSSSETVFSHIVDSSNNFYAVMCQQSAVGDGAIGGIRIRYTTTSPD